MTQPSYDPVFWNDPAIMAAAGNAPGAVTALLARHAQPVPTHPAVYQWTSRCRIPNGWRPKIIYALLAEKRITPGALFRVGSAARGVTAKKTE